MLFWTRYILYTGVDEHEDQPVQNRMTGRHLRQGGSSWTTAPAAAVPAQRTGTQPGTPQPSSPWSNPSPAAHLGACWKVGEEQHRPRQPILRDRSNLNLVQWRSVQQRLTGHNWQNLLETDGHHDGILSADNGYQLFAQRSDHTGPNEKVFVINCWEPRMIWDNVFFPLLHKGQWWRLLDFLQQALYKSSQLSESVVTLICCSGGVNKIIGNWNRNMYHR